ncbi:TetR/AcrR family transcriptional regulator, partial [Burkholderia pseudomallei]|nr:TetR/AcrR family transcriptional regulator [Burkholderia pseudomallei]
VSNPFALAATLGRDFTQPDERAEMVRMNTEVLLAYLLRR